MIGFRCHFLKAPKICLRKISATCSNQYAKYKTENAQPPPTDKVVTITADMVNPCQPEPSVVIIGAGMAGLSAAHRLNQCGISNFTILEATDRPGGRIHSCWIGDAIAELGANHIIGASSANPVFNLACQEGLLSPPMPRVDDSTGLYCTSEGHAIDMCLALTAHYRFKQLKEEAVALLRYGKEHSSLMSFLQMRIEEEILNFPVGQRNDVSRVLYGLTNQLRCRIGDDLCRVSADKFGNITCIPGGSIRVPLGYISILSPLIRDLPACCLRHSKIVANIRWGPNASRTGKSRAVVICCDGEEFSADYVIVTVSLGVLKNHGRTLFSPQLPATKIVAIEGLGYGHVNKIFLEYERPFWIRGEGGINFAWSADEINNRCEWVRAISCVEEVSKNILCAHVSGAEAMEMENASDEEIAEDITKVLRKFTGDPLLTYPSFILRSKWSNDPFFGGACSYLGVGSTVDQQCDISCPLPGVESDELPILFFAGEATCMGHFSTVHGARMSGIREAERIIALTKRLNGPPPTPEATN